MTDKTFRVLGFIRWPSINFISPKCLLVLYNTLVCSVLKCGLVVWSSYSAADIHRIDRVKNCFMSFTGLCFNILYPKHDYRAISQALKLNSFSARRDKFGINFIRGLIEGRFNAQKLFEFT